MRKTDFYQHMCTMVEDPIDYIFKMEGSFLMSYRNFYLISKLCLFLDSGSRDFCISVNLHVNEDKFEHIFLSVYFNTFFYFP